MRPAHAGVRAAEGGGHVFFAQVCVRQRTCVHVCVDGTEG